MHSMRTTKVFFRRAIQKNQNMSRAKYVSNPTTKSITKARTFKTYKMKV